MSEFETLILRFRDFSESNTIDEHKRIIDTKGSVYWGWWAKPQEQVPLMEMSIFRKSISSGKDIFLFDSGTQRVYRARCIGLFSNEGDMCSVEDTSYVPEYYRTTQCKMWFKFSQISNALTKEECKKVLQEYAYVRVDHFFVSGEESPSRIFENKIVYGTQELFEQQVTIWFLRKAKHDDARHEIHSYQHDYTSDEKALRAFRILNTNTMLWLSDLHFSEDQHGFTSIPGSENTLGECLKRALKVNPHSDRDMEEISYAIVSGDLTFKCLKEEFEEAEKFFVDMNSHFGLNNSLYTIVPGNHDIAFSSEPYDETKKVEVAYESAKQNYVEFYQRYTGYRAEDYLFTIQRVLTNNLLPVEIIGLNSCVLQQTEGHFQGMGYVGQNQLDALRKYLDKTDRSHAFRILVLHHHIIPAMYTEIPEMNPMYSTMIDAGRLLEFIKERHINVVLHGHVHREFYIELLQKYNNVDEEKGDDKHKVYIVGIGSVGVKANHLSEGRNNMFGLLKFRDNELLVEGYQLNPTGEKGNLLFRHRVPYEESHN